MDSLDVQRLLTPDVGRLAPVSLADALAAYLEACPAGSATFAEAQAALSSLARIPVSREQVEALGADARFAKRGAMISLANAVPAEPRSGKRTLAAAREALAAQSASAGRTADLTAAVLIRLFDLPVKPGAPIGAVRYAILDALTAAAFGRAMSAEKAPKRFQMDAISRALYLAFAGLKSGTAQQAERAILRRAFGVSGRSFDLADAVLRRAMAPAPGGLNGAAAVAQPRPQDRDGLAGFAEEVRRIARTLETKPYKGRVAIAQVYDAAVERGLPLGSLDDFKTRLAEAARESLLDLERYDIAGPFDAALKERSRTRLGRDERHFIVNQWI